MLLIKGAKTMFIIVFIMFNIVAPIIYIVFTIIDYEGSVLKYMTTAEMDEQRNGLRIMTQRHKMRNTNLYTTPISLPFYGCASTKFYAIRQQCHLALAVEISQRLLKGLFAHTKALGNFF